MKRSGLLATSVVLAVTLLPVQPAAAGPAQRLDWGFAGDGRNVRMFTTEPSAADGHVHVKFKRYGGMGQRQVRIAELQRHPVTPLTYSDPVKLQVGEAAVFTTGGSIPCEPARRPLHVQMQMRIKLPGRPWERWQNWAVVTHFILEC
jgi:hypothetical protein